MDITLKGPGMKIKDKGFSLIEVMIALSVLGAITVGLMSFFQDQHKNANTFEFMGKKEQLRLSLIGQFLSKSENCKCLFQSSDPFPKEGIQALSGVTVDTIGKFDIPTPGSCDGSSIPKPLISKSGIDDMKLVHANLKRIKLVSGSYIGDFDIFLQSTKPITGPKVKLIRIPVSIPTKPAGQNLVKIDGCSMKSDSQSELPVQWVKSFNSSPLPLVIDVPEGTKQILVTITARHYIGLPGDKGRTAGSQFYYSSNLNGTPIQFAEMEVGAGNNNGAQARLVGTTTGVIPIVGETQIIISRQGMLYNEGGGLMCSSGSCGVTYNQKAIVLMGLNTEPYFESSNPLPPPSSNNGPSGPSGPKFNNQSME